MRYLLLLLLLTSDLSPQFVYRVLEQAWKENYPADVIHEFRPRPCKMRKDIFRDIRWWGNTILIAAHTTASPAIKRIAL